MLYKIFKNSFWRFAYWGYPILRDVLLFLRIMKHSGRQEYHLGKLRSDFTEDRLMEILNKEGFERDIIAWIDDGEVLSMRKRADKLYQYHVRLFEDREVRGHYEYAPESKPLKHLFGVVFLPKEKYLKDLLEEFLD